MSDQNEWKTKYEKMQKGLALALEEFHGTFPAGLGFSGDAILHFLHQLCDGETPTNWGDEVMNMINEAEAKSEEKP